MTDYSLPVITVTSPLQRAQKILAREQIGAHGRNGRTSSTTLSHDELFAQDSALVLIGQRQATPAGLRKRMVEQREIERWPTGIAGAGRRSRALWRVEQRAACRPAATRDRDSEVGADASYL